MKQKRFPCCKKPMKDIDIFGQDTGDANLSSCPMIACPNCGALLTIYLNIDSVEVCEE